MAAKPYHLVDYGRGSMVDGSLQGCIGNVAGGHRRLDEGIHLDTSGVSSPTELLYPHRRCLEPLQRTSSQLEVPEIVGTV